MFLAWYENQEIDCIKGQEIEQMDVIESYGWERYLQFTLAAPIFIF